jgi:hypothetical protein
MEATLCGDHVAGSSLRLSICVSTHFKKPTIFQRSIIVLTVTTKSNIIFDCGGKVVFDGFFMAAENSILFLLVFLPAKIASLCRQK